MKKRTMTKLIGLLACLCLITSCFVGSTLAKYVVGASASDTARVAKFGVEVTASGNLFSDQYIDAPATSGTLTVIGASNAQVVAPGTNSGAGLTIGVTGTPEVAVDVTFTVTTTSDIFLAATTGNAGYADLTTAGNVNDGFPVAAEYHPLKFTLSKGGTPVTGAQGVTLAELETFFGTFTDTYAPGTNLGTAIGNYTITWEWDYDDSGNGTYDKEDTLLGDLANNSAILAKSSDITAATPTWVALTAGTGNDYSTDVNVAFAITVTQAD